MKKTLLSLFISISVLTAKAQVVDFTFENPWSASLPAGWVAGVLINPAVLVKDTAVKHFGSASARLTTSVLTGASALTGGVVPDTSGIMLTGTLTIFPTQSLKVGYPFTTREDSLGFFYRYNPVGNDTAFAAAALTKVRAGSDTLAFGLTKLNATGGAWQIAYIKLDYQPGVGGTETPDTAAIAFSSSGVIGYQLGSQLWIDDLQWGTINSGIQKNEIGQQVWVFPNPAGNFVKIDVSAINTARSIVIYDALGKETYHMNINQQVETISTASWANGIYTYQISGTSGERLSIGKISISK